MDIPHDAFSELRIPTYDWRAVFPPSLRVRNVVLIADALERRPYLKFEDPLALLEADKAERAFYVTSLGDFDYSMRIEACVHRIRNVRNYLQGVPPGKTPGLKNVAPMPTSYFMMQPLSNECMMERYLKPSDNFLSRRNLLIVLDKEQCKKDVACGPFESLVQRHKEISCCVDQLLSMFRSKLEISKLSHSSVHLACCKLSTDLMELTNKLKAPQKQPADMDLELEIKSLEETYVRLIKQAFTTFIRSINSLPLYLLNYELDCEQSKCEKGLVYQHIFMTRHGLAYQVPHKCTTDDCCGSALLDLTSVLGDTHNSPGAQQQAQPGLLFEQHQQSDTSEYQPMLLSNEDMEDTSKLIDSNGLQ